MKKFSVISMLTHASKVDFQIENQSLRCGKQASKIFKTLASMLAMMVAVAAWADTPEKGDRYETPTIPPMRFETLGIYIDAGDKPLAAYQFELTTSRGDVKIVGIEGGQGVFSKPPYYDPAAMKQDRVKVGAFSLADELPTGKVKVAVLHVVVSGDLEPEYAVKLTTAASKDGEKIEAEVRLGI
ncbi:MAG: hypothetical protein K9M57_07770 [Phycisphaerae bacterium]|nr:hypothetical protein [Phycisphaerae bacterium]